jgi:seryl-tRNA synthetase
MANIYSGTHEQLCEEILRLEAENLRVRTQRNELRAQVQQLTGDLRERASKRSKERIAEFESEVERLRQICRDAYEVWAGSNGIPEPITCVEDYMLQLLISMRDEVKRGLK